MPRQNYMTISVADTVQDMFNEFVSIKGITKTSALADVLEMYMLAKDEELYAELKKKYLNVEAVKQMIQDRDNKVKDNDFIFIRLSGKTQDKNGNEVNAYDIMNKYIEDEQKNGSTWFSTQSLYYGMSDDKVAQYNELITIGEEVKMLFGIAESAGGKNDIDYVADVKQIYSSKTPTGAPDENYPEDFKGEKAKIWIKISNIKREEEINASMLKIKSTGADLKKIITNSQYHFGYVCFKD